MPVEKSDEVLIADLRRDAAIWFKDTSLNDLEELIARYSNVARLESENARLRAERDALHAKLNTPELVDFPKGVTLEAAHQRDRWGAENDAGKAPLDWFWLIGYLAQKAAMSAIAGDIDKAKHHTISTAAALANWHAALSGGDNKMRPGIDPACVKSPESELTSLRAKVEELQAGNARLMERDILLVKKGDGYIDEIDRLERKIEELQAALEPLFLSACNATKFISSREKMHPDGVKIYQEDIERARAALAKSKE